MDSFNKQIFQAGDLAVLYDRRSREYMVQLQESDRFESHIGNLNHSEIIGKPEGSWLPTTTGHLLLAFKTHKISIHPEYATSGHDCIS